MRETVKKTKLTENCSKQTIQLFVEELIPKLSVEEKVGIMSGQVTEQKLLDDLFLIEHYNIKPYPTMAVERLGIPKCPFRRWSQRSCGRNRYLLSCIHGQRSNL
ncbi:hypothetical protein [Lacrimispora xylanisolvens]|uniref:hypothetical protein n=1 Tax=Lacrimispora xylanisolvens TaxID=384636 RepID=UPI002402B17A